MFCSMVVFVKKIVNVQCTYIQTLLLPVRRKKKIKKKKYDVSINSLGKQCVFFTPPPPPPGPGGGDVKNLKKKKTKLQ